MPASIAPSGRTNEGAIGTDDLATGLEGSSTLKPALPARGAAT
jgi:hypothetical protein